MLCQAFTHLPLPVILQTDGSRQGRQPGTILWARQEGPREDRGGTRLGWGQCCSEERACGLWSPADLPSREESVPSQLQGHQGIPGLSHTRHTARPTRGPTLCEGWAAHCWAQPGPV